MVLKPQRVSPPAATTTARSQRQSRRTRRNEPQQSSTSPTAEILELPRDKERLTRSKSRDGLSRGERISFYEQKFFSVPRASRNRSAEQPRVPVEQNAQKPSKKGKNKKKTTAKKTGKTSNETQQQSPESDWEDLSDEPLQEQVPPGDLGSSPEVQPPGRSRRPVLQELRLPLQSPLRQELPQGPRRSPRLLQPPDLLPREQNRSPIAHVSSPVPPSPSIRLRKKLQQFKNTESGPSTSQPDPPATSRATKASKKNAAAAKPAVETTTESSKQPSTSGVGRSTRRNPAGLVPANAAPSTRADKTLENPPVREEDVENLQANHAVESQFEEESQPKKTSGKTVQKGMKPRVEDPKQGIDLIDLNSSTEVEFPVDESNAEVQQSARGSKKPQKGSQGKSAGHEIVEDVGKSSEVASLVKDSKNLPSTSGVRRVTRRNPGGLVPVVASSSQENKNSGDPPVDDNIHSERAESPSKSEGNKGEKKPKPKVRIQFKEKITSPARESVSSEDFPPFDCGDDDEEESVRERDEQVAELTGAGVANDTPGDIRNDSAPGSRDRNDQPSTSGLEQRTSVNDVIPSSDEDEEVPPAEEIPESPEITPVSQSPRPTPSIFDPDSSLRLSNASTILPDHPTASSTHHYDNVQIDENPEDMVDVPGPPVPPKTPERKTLNKRVQFKSRSEHLGSTGGDSGIQGPSGTEEQSTDDSGAGNSNNTTDIQDVQHNTEVEREEHPGDHVEMPKSSIPSKIPVKDKAKSQRDKFKTRTENIDSTDDPDKENQQNVLNVGRASSNQNISQKESSGRTTRAGTSRNKLSAGTPSPPAPEVDPSDEDNNSTFDISQLSNITFRKSRSSRVSRAPQEKEDVLEDSNIHTVASPVVEEAEVIEEPTTPVSNVDRFGEENGDRGKEESEVEEAEDETEVIEVQKPPLNPSKAPAALIPQHLSIEIQERQNINLNTRNSPPPNQNPRPTIALPYTTPEWQLIKEQLKEDSPDLAALKKTILRYHQDKQNEWKFKGLENFLNSIEPSESEDFLHKVLREMKELAIKMPELLPKRIQVRQQNQEGTTETNQRIVGCLLANAFFCTFNAEEGGEYGGRFLNFSQLFESFEEGEDAVSEGRNRIVKEKFQLLHSYFSSIPDKGSSEEMKIHRVHCPSGPSWWALPLEFKPVNIVSSLGDHPTGVQVVETTGRIGGDLFGFTAEAEEIYSFEHPELMVARLFMEPLGDDEAIFFSGIRKYSNVEGSGSSFRFAGKSDDVRPRTVAYIRGRNVEAGEDFKREHLKAELDKMYLVLQTVKKDLGAKKTVMVQTSRRPGDRRENIVRFLIVAMAASLTDMSVTFSTLEDELLKETIMEIQDLIIKEKVEIKSLFVALCDFGTRYSTSGLLFPFLQKKFRKSQ